MLMRFCRFNEGRLGIVDGADIRDVTAALDVLPSYRYPLPGYDVLVAHLADVRARVEAVRSHAPVVPLSARSCSVRLRTLARSSPRR